MIIMGKEVDNIIIREEGELLCLIEAEAEGEEGLSTMFVMREPFLNWQIRLLSHLRHQLKMGPTLLAKPLQLRQLNPLQPPGKIHLDGEIIELILILNYA